MWKLCSCFQPFWLSGTFSLPLAQICQADSPSQVKPSRRHGRSHLSAPRLHALPAQRRRQIPTPRLIAATSPAGRHLRDSPLFYPDLLRVFRDHVTHQSGVLPPTAINTVGAGAGAGAAGGQALLAQAELSVAPVKKKKENTPVRIIYDISVTLINSSELYSRRSTDTMTSATSREAAGAIRFSPAHSISPLPSPTIFVSLLLFLLISIWVLFMASEVGGITAASRNPINIKTAIIITLRLDWFHWSKTLHVFHCSRFSMQSCDPGLFC